MTTVRLQKIGEQLEFIEQQIGSVRVLTINREPETNSAVIRDEDLANILDEIRHSIENVQMALRNPGVLPDAVYAGEIRDYKEFKSEVTLNLVHTFQILIDGPDHQLLVYFYQSETPNGRYSEFLEQFGVRFGRDLIGRRVWARLLVREFNRECRNVVRWVSPEGVTPSQMA